MDTTRAVDQIKALKKQARQRIREATLASKVAQVVRALAPADNLRERHSEA